MPVSVIFAAACDAYYRSPTQRARSDAGRDGAGRLHHPDGVGHPTCRLLLR
jgi:hypothetical protein